MPRFTLPSLLLVFATLFSVSAHAASAINTGLFGHTAVKGYDVVAYHTDQRAVQGDEAYSTDWMGAHWRFASAGHLKLFQGNPQRYAPQYGGYCAFAVAKGDLVGIDPEAFTVIGDKLYLNYSKKIRGQWEADRDNYIRKADANWPGLIQ